MMYRLALLLSLFALAWLKETSGTAAQQPHSSFLSDVFQSQEQYESSKHFRVRQVPGDGGCLFHALTVCLDYCHSSKHCDFGSAQRRISNHIRRLAVDLLQRGNDTFVMDNKETIPSSQLLAVVADHYNMTTEEYCRKMVQPNTWGGGPEIVAICNHLKRPIHVYELSGTETTDAAQNKPLQQKKPRLGAHKFKLCAKFGSPTFDKKSPLHILCADGRFPDVEPSQAKKVGDHFLALFPCDGSGDIVSQTLSERQEEEEGKWWKQLSEPNNSEPAAGLRGWSQRWRNGK